MNSLQRLHDLGQSIWLDYIRRDLVSNGQLARLIEAGEIRGITSNPTIFEEAIAKSDLYNAAIRPLAHAEWSPEQITDALAVEDVKAATDLFLPLYEGSHGKDGFVSIEVNPLLADDTEATLTEARRLWSSINRPNLMVKIPATGSGVPAIEQAISEGINVNVTLVFSLDRYNQVIESYLRGLERRVEARLPIDRVASVASFFVSRVDTAVDAELEAIVREEGASAPKALALFGKAAIANAKLAYAQFKAAFSGARFDRLRQVGGRTQRPLWASTSTKNPAYPDVLYVEELIGEGTVNTLPPKSLEAFRHHGMAEPRLDKDLAVARAQMEALEALGISMAAVTERLEWDGVRKFADSYERLVKTVGERAGRMQNELGSLRPALAATLERLDRDRVGGRFWRRDRSLWSPDRRKRPALKRLEWLELKRGDLTEPVGRLTAAARARNPKQVGWIGPTGLVSAIEEAIGPAGAVHTQVLEALDPPALRKFAEATPIESTVFCVAGTGALERAGLEDSWQRIRSDLATAVAERFLALAPQGSSLHAVARDRGFSVLEADPVFSPLSPGLALAGLMGAAPEDLVAGALSMRERSGAGWSAARNPGLYLGAFLGAAAGTGIVRIGLVADRPIEALARLLAIELGGRGIASRLTFLSSAPVELALGDAAIVYLRVDGAWDPQAASWQDKGAPVLVLQAQAGLSGIGQELVRWEVGAAVAAHLAGVLPFPAAAPSDRAVRLVKTFLRTRKVGRGKPAVATSTFRLWTGQSGFRLQASRSIPELAERLLADLGAGQTLGLGVYSARTPTIDSRLAGIRGALAAGRSADFESWYGRLPSRVGRPGSGPSILVAGGSGSDLELPELRIQASTLQWIQAFADFEDLRHAGDPVSLAQFAGVEAAAEFLDSLEQVARR
jgi:transaldolase/glucose-6-phosphate isomerase